MARYGSRSSCGIELGGLVVEPRLDVGRSRPPPVASASSSAVAKCFPPSKSSPSSRRRSASIDEMLPAPPHCAASCPPGRRTDARFANSDVVIDDPVERRRRQDRVDRRRRRGSARRGRRPRVHSTRSPNERERVRACSTIALEPSTATPVRGAAAPADRSVTRPVPQPASMHAFVALELEPIDDHAAPAGLRRRERRSYADGVPLAGHAVRLPERQRSSSSRRSPPGPARRRPRCPASGITTSVTRLRDDERLAPARRVPRGATGTNRARTRTPGTRDIPAPCRAREPRGPSAESYGRDQRISGRSARLERAPRRWYVTLVSVAYYHGCMPTAPPATDIADLASRLRLGVTRLARKLRREATPASPPRSWLPSARSSATDR